MFRLDDGRARLWSIEDVRRILAESLWDVSRGMMALEKFRECDQFAPLPIDILTPEEGGSVENWFQSLRESAVNLSLPLSIISIDRVIAVLRDKPNITCGEFVVMAEEISSRIPDELSTRLVFQIDQQYSAYYRQSHLFGQAVSDAFKSATQDIEEAGTCLACHRATAAVFHLMRVMEVGLRAMGKSLNNPDLSASSNRTWEAILRKCDQELAKPVAQRTPEWRAGGDFFSEAIANLRAVKDAWRNPTMHVEKSYTPDEAEDVFRSVRSFVRHLAGKLKE